MLNSNFWKNVLSGTVFWSALFVLVLGASSPDAAAGSTLRVSKAGWDARQSALKVEGRGTSGDEISIYNAGSHERLGTDIVSSKGSWKLVLTDIGNVPCTVLVETSGSAPDVQKSVRKAPATCLDQPPAPTLADIEIQGPDSVQENTSTNYTAVAIFSDGSRQTVTDLSAWSVTPPGSAAISDDGAMTASEVSQDQTVNIAASYTYADITKTMTLTTLIVDTGDIILSGSHAGKLSNFEGTRTCLACHRDKAIEVHASLHYQWKGDASEVVGLEGTQAGKLGGINDFCIYPDINWIGKLTNIHGEQKDGGCAKCHVGLGKKPTGLASDSQLENIDCLICHSEEYKRTVEMVDGAYQYVPDTDKMPVSIDQAAADITLPSRDTCLSCHVYAGGGNNFKRGDLEATHAIASNPTRQFDVHMASTANGGAGLNCLDCHTASGHKIAGRGTDLRPREMPDEVSCTQCHDQQPHENGEINKHLGRVNCTVCHIPTFAKQAPTDMDRDWSRPGVLVASKGLYEPDHEKGTNVIPEYRFFNGSSHFYKFGDTAVPGGNNSIVMSEPDGSVTDGAKIYAFKRHSAFQPIEKGGLKRLLPLKIGKFFETGDIQEAVELGVEQVGWEYSGHAFAETERYMGLFHEVAPKEDALTCNSCHDGGNRLDFAALGYTPNATYNDRPLCASCHSDESGEWSAGEYFQKVHTKHVDDKKLDCVKCHIFSSSNG